MEIEEKPEFPSMKLSEHISEIMLLLEEGSIGVALAYLEWLIDRLGIHEINPDLGHFEKPSKKELVEEVVEIE